MRKPCPTAPLYDIILIYKLLIIQFLRIFYLLRVKPKESSNQASGSTGHLANFTSIPVQFAVWKIIISVESEQEKTGDGSSLQVGC